MKTIVTCFALLALAGLTGCANYRYFVVEPADAAQVVPDKAPTVVDYAPLRYQLSERGNRLTMAIANPTEGAITLTRRSYLVTPGGDTQPLPLPQAVIGPRSYVAMVLPPETQVTRRNPAYGLSFGFGHQTWPGGFGYHPWGEPFYQSGFGFHSPFYYEPPYYVAQVPVWDWHAGQVRMRLHYEEEQSTNTFEHHFTIERRQIENR